MYHVNSSPPSEPQLPIDVVDFIEARLAEEESDARAAGDLHPEWTYDRETFTVACDGWSIATKKGPSGESPINDVDGAHIARQNPAVTLARVEALRGLVDLIVTWDEGTPEQSPVMPGDVLPRIAAIWRHHADYREEWS